jgi:uncharacterized protein (TIGR02594 family)
MLSSAKALLTILVYAQIGIAEPDAAIQDYLASVNLKGDYAWCSAFVNYNLKSVGIEGTDKANARSFLKFGKEVTEPKKMDVVVLWRGSKTSWKGHVGFFIKQDDTHVYLLGGNQRDSVNITAYSKSRVLGYRRFGE